jgi:hypothetical protein
MQPTADTQLSCPELLIVAGISGSGKSTFIKQLKLGRLPDDLILPEGVQDWPVIGSSPQVYPNNVRGLVLHYDMNGRKLYDGRDYRADPALDLVRHARAVTVVNIRPPRTRLVEQLSARESRRQERQRCEQARLIWRLAAPLHGAAEYVMPRPLMKVINRRIPFRDFGKRLEGKRRIYEQPGWLDDMYARWESYLDSVAQTGKPMRRIFIEPEAASFQWRVMRPAASVAVTESAISA